MNVMNMTFLTSDTGSLGAPSASFANGPVEKNRCYLDEPWYAKIVGEGVGFSLVRLRIQQLMCRVSYGKVFGR